jgi:hypothetical protein
VMHADMFHHAVRNGAVQRRIGIPPRANLIPAVGDESIELH